ncbi:MAG: acyltransferase [candidate division Zixibacteria bacterium]|nr:acyltransferase [candidate division Zixibacteria bacterium]
MDFSNAKTFQSHGDGVIRLDAFKSLGENAIFENGVLVFHEESISLGANVYVGHNAILKAYYKNEMIIGSDTWIGQGCYFHSAGGITIGKAVGIGPMVKMLTSYHIEGDIDKPVMHNELAFEAIIIGDGADIGVGSTILPGVTIGKGAIVGAGSVVTNDIPEYAIAAGVPARVMRMREDKDSA